jgi:hypothetical protein
LEELNEFKRRGIQAAKENGLVIEVEAKQLEERKQTVCEENVPGNGNGAGNNGDGDKIDQNLIEDRDK